MQSGFTNTLYGETFRNPLIMITLATVQHVALCYVPSLLVIKLCYKR